MPSDDASVGTVPTVTSRASSCHQFTSKDDSNSAPTVVVATLVPRNIATQPVEADNHSSDESSVSHSVHGDFASLSEIKPGCKVEQVTALSSSLSSIELADESQGSKSSSAFPMSHRQRAHKNKTPVRPVGRGGDIHALVSMLDSLDTAPCKL